VTELVDIRTGELLPIPEQPIAAIIYHERAVEALEANAEPHHWDAARLIASELMAGVGVRELARAIGKDKVHVQRRRDMWLVYGDLSPHPPGNQAYNRASRIVRDRRAEQRRIEQAKQEALTTGLETTVDIRHGDFREELADLENIDAIITDPPYPREFLPLLGDLASWADKILTDDGVLAVLMGQTHLPEVYRLLDGHRSYRWTAAYLTPGNAYVSHARDVHSNWKPLLVYGGGPRLADVITSEGDDADAKNNHQWGQDYNAFHTIVERLTTRGQTVVDPFMGSGTTLLAAHALGRHAIGCDIDVTAVTRAKERLG
jgi:DNA methylase